MTELKDPAVQAAIAQLGLTPGKNGEKAIPAGSKQKVVEPTPQPKPLKKKKMSIELDAIQEARLIREANIVGLTVKEYLQNLIDEKLKADIGRKLIGGAKFMGTKVTAPTNSFGREVNNA